MRKSLVGGAIGLAATLAAVAGIVGFPQKTTAQSDDRLSRIAAALEAYAVDNTGQYPVDRFGFNGRTGTFQLNPVLTTPIAYLSAMDLIDPFAIPINVELPFLRYRNIEKLIADNPGNEDYKRLKARHGSWLVWSGNSPVRNPETTVTFDLGRYDPTNGTQSSGSVLYPMNYSYRSQRMVRETGLD